MPKDDKGREIPSRFYIDEGDLVFKDADPLTEEDPAELKRMKNLIGIKEQSREQDPLKQGLELKGKLTDTIWKIYFTSQSTLRDEIRCH
jgi:hypothetical protein